jgi:uncharacterized lipoprotein YajG
MKKLLLISLLFVTACSSTPTIKGYEGPKAMQRNDVIEGARSCVNTRMKPQIIYLPQKTEFGSILVPVDVHCEVYK